MPKLNSFISYSDDCHFPLENLPYGVFSTKSDDCPRIGVAIGNLILDLKNTNGIFNGPLLKDYINIFNETTLNSFMALSKSHWKEARECLQSYLSIENKQNLSKGVFVKQSESIMHLPATVGDYSDFFSSYHHAYNCSLMFKMDILKSNWRYLPLAYHGRSSTIVISGTHVRRPCGQIIANYENPIPTFEASKKLDYELEVGVFVGGKLNNLGESFNITKLEENIFGIVLLNDWSARDIQSWEMVPLGPFLGKSFVTTISPWIVTMDALEQFKVENVHQDPKPLPYLLHEDNYNFDINLEAYLKAPGSSPTKISKSNYKYLYWTAKQQLCHHMSNGCTIKPGDIMGSGTISGPTDDSCGCLMETTFNGKNPITLSDGQTRTFIEDGDEVIFTGYCVSKYGQKIGFGECTGKVLSPILQN